MIILPEGSVTENKASSVERGCEVVVEVAAEVVVDDEDMLEIWRENV